VGNSEKSFHATYRAIERVKTRISVHFNGIRDFPIQARKTQRTIDLQGFRVVHPEELESPTF
jgi:hypothetical protein